MTEQPKTEEELHSLPPDLPVPEDDGAADHLTGARFPALTLASTVGALNLGAQAAGTLVLYVYPRTGKPGEPSPDGWDAIPGARGCTPQSCAFRDHHAELRELGASVVGPAPKSWPTSTSSPSASTSPIRSWPTPSCGSPLPWRCPPSRWRACACIGASR